ncbi:UNVERIFIED_ORG: hypothetical protein GGE11_003251 [Mycolicibacterium obuense]
MIAERCLGAVARAWDVGGRRAAVDAMLSLPGGQVAAFEVTKIGAAGAFQRDALLAADDHSWPLPGEWWWTIQVGSEKDIPRLKDSYKTIIRVCEAKRVARPEELGWSPDAHPDVRWLVQRSSSDMTGHPKVLTRDLPGGPNAMVVPAGQGGGVDTALVRFNAALADAFRMPHIPKHFDKLAAAVADQRHLFIAMHDSGLPFSVFYELSVGEALPPEAPPVPSYISDLWLAPRWSRRVLRWSRRTGWVQYRPYDS